MKSRSIAEVLEDKDFIVIGGQGGVGKTTLSCALGIRLATEGRRVALLTIDPARRLAAALGMKKLGNKLVKVRLRTGDGSLSAAMLDVKTTFDEMVTRYAPSAAVRDRILSNPLYQQLSEALSGTHEYMALERIYQIHSSGEYDVVVIDTPPTSAFSDFLRAPDRLKAFFDREVLKWFLPRFSSLPLGMGMDFAFSMFRKLAGGTLLEQMVSFLSDFHTLLEGWIERIQKIESLLESESSAFLYVASADSADEADLPSPPEWSAILLNRWLTFEAGWKDAAHRNHPLYKAAAITNKRQNAALKSLKKRYPKIPLIPVPLQAKDPTKLADLAAMLEDSNAA